MGSADIETQLRAVEVRVPVIRRDAPPLVEFISYGVEPAADEPERMLALLHENLEKDGMKFNSVAPDPKLSGVLMRIEA